MKSSLCLAALFGTCALLVMPINAQSEAEPVRSDVKSEAKTEASTKTQWEFEEPQLLMAGDKELGTGQLYPSPVLFDNDADGTQELITGDLFGRLMVHKKAEKGWSAPEALKNAEGKGVKFHNW